MSHGIDPAVPAPGEALPEYRVRAHNGSTQSENKIHDDAVARQFGFAGGLVPGVTVYAYMTRPVAAALGRAWVERGRMSARFLKPFYEGEQVTVRTTVAAGATPGVHLTVEALNDAGDACAVGTASVPLELPAAPAIAAYPAADLPAQRPPASPEAFAQGILGSLDETFAGGEMAESFLAEINDDLAVYRAANGLAHPGWLIRRANTILAANVLLGPWIHVSSDVTHFSGVRAGEPLATRGRVTDVFERKGHRFVELDVAMFTGERPVIQVRHTAIYEPRRAG